MNKEHSLPPIEKLRCSVDETARRLSGVFTTYLLAGIYIAVAIATTTDKQLLLETKLQLPLLTIALPVRGFYIVVPFALLVLHLYLLLNIYFLSIKQVAFEEALQKLQDKSEQDWQRGLLLPLAISPLSIQAERSLVIRSVLRLIIWVTVIAAPPVLLEFIQLQFLPYHSVPITWWHRAIFLLDLAVLWVIWRIILNCRPKKHEPRSSRISKILCRLRVAAMCLMIMTSCLFSLVVATVPGESLDRPARFLDRLKDQLHRNLIVRSTTFVEEAPPPELVAVYIQQGKTVDDAWLDHAKGIRLQERDLRGADFSYSSFYNADLRGVRLDSATLAGSNFQGANLSRVKKQSGGFVPSSLRGANLFDADLQGANLMYAELQGADLSAAKLQGVNLYMANLQAVKTPVVTTLGKALAGVDLRGASLFGVKLQAADLPGANLQGVDLRTAQLQGANLEEANLKGSFLAYAEFQGANLKAAILDICDLSNVQVGPLTAGDADNIRKQLAGALSDSTLESALSSIPLQGKPTKLDLPEKLRVRGAFYGNDFAKVAAIPGPMPVDQYLQGVESFLVKLACSSRPIGQALAYRTGFLLKDNDEFAPVLAHALLQAESKGECAILKDIRKDYHEVLDKAGKTKD